MNPSVPCGASSFASVHRYEALVSFTPTFRLGIARSPVPPGTISMVFKRKLLSLLSTGNH